MKNKKLNLKSKVSKAFADDSLMITIINNLVSNATKFNNSGGFISIESRKKNNRELILVKDNGDGINEEELNNLFEPERNFSNMILSNDNTINTSNDNQYKSNRTVSVSCIKNHGAEFILCLPNSL